MNIENEKPKQKNKVQGCLKICAYGFCGLMCLILFITMISEGDKETKETDNLPVSDIEWSEISSIYGQNSDKTDLQKENTWKKYKGKKIQWTGKVHEIEKSFGTLQMQVVMNRSNNTVHFGDNSFSSPLLDVSRVEVVVFLKDSETEKASNLESSSSVTFEGILDDWDPIIIDNGIIVKNKE